MPTRQTEQTGISFLPRFTESRRFAIVDGLTRNWWSGTAVLSWSQLVREKFDQLIRASTFLSFGKSTCLTVVCLFKKLANIQTSLKRTRFTSFIHFNEIKTHFKKQTLQKNKIKAIYSSPAVLETVPPFHLLKYLKPSHYSCESEMCVSICSL